MERLTSRGFARVEFDKGRMDSRKEEKFFLSNWSIPESTISCRNFRKSLGSLGKNCPCTITKRRASSSPAMSAKGLAFILDHARFEERIALITVSAALPLVTRKGCVIGDVLRKGALWGKRQAHIFQIGIYANRPRSGCHP